MKEKVNVSIGDEVVSMYLTRAKAIKMKCLDCCSTHQCVRECDAYDCPFYEIRTTGIFKGADAGKKRIKAIKDYCTSCMGGDKYMIKDCTSDDCSLFSFKKGYSL